MCTELGHEKLSLARVCRPHNEHIEWNVDRIHFNTVQIVTVHYVKLGVGDYEDMAVYCS